MVEGQGMTPFYTDEPCAICGLDCDYKYCSEICRVKGRRLKNAKRRHKPETAKAHRAREHEEVRTRMLAILNWKRPEIAHENSIVELGSFDTRLPRRLDNAECTAERLGAKPKRNGSGILSPGRLHQHDDRNPD